MHTDEFWTPRIPHQSPQSHRVPHTGGSCRLGHAGEGAAELRKPPGHPTGWGLPPARWMVWMIYKGKSHENKLQIDDENKRYPPMNPPILCIVSVIQIMMENIPCLGMGHMRDRWDCPWSRVLMHWCIPRLSFHQLTATQSSCV